MSLPLITSLSETFIREFINEVRGTIPAEKIKADLDEAFIGRALIAEGPVKGPGGLGQKLGEIPARVFYRWSQEFPGCWQNKEFVDEFFRDNSRLKSPGWTPKAAKALRHGVTFVGGKSVSNLNTVKNTRT